MTIVVKGIGKGFLTLGQFITLGVSRFVGATPIEKELENFLSGETAFWKTQIDATDLTGESVEIELRWKDEPSATKARIALDILSAASIYTYIYLIKKYNGYIRDVQALNDIVVAQKFAKEIKTVGAGQSSMNALYKASGEVSKIVNDIGNLQFESLLRELIPDAPELIEEFSYQSLAQFEKGVSEIEELNEQTRAAKKMPKGAVRDAELARLRSKSFDLVNGLQSQADDFLTAVEDLEKKPQLAKYFKTKSRIAKKILGALGKIAIFDLIAFLGTLAIDPFTTDEQEQEAINATIGVALEPFNGVIASWPQGEFAEYYDLTLPLGFADILLSMVMKEVLEDYFTDIPLVEDLKSILVYALLPLEEFMYIKIGGVSIVQDIDFDTTQFLDDLIPNWKAMANAEFLEKLFDLFLGAVALKALWVYYFKPIVGSIK